MQLESELIKSEEQLKNARTNHEKEKQKIFRDNCISLKNQICVIKKLSDSIAWQMIDGQQYIARRLFQGSNQKPFHATNYLDVIKKVDTMNESNRYHLV